VEVLNRLANPISIPEQPNIPYKKNGESRTCTNQSGLEMFG